MKLVTFLILSMNAIFVAQTASVLRVDEENGTIGGVKNEENNVENKISERDDVDLQTDNSSTEFKFTEPVSLDDLWSEYFETEYISVEMTGNQQLTEQVLEILRLPKKLAESMKSESQPISTIDQYEKIRIKVQSSTQIASSSSNEPEYNNKDTTQESVRKTFFNDSNQEGVLTEWLIYKEYETTMQPSTQEIPSGKDLVEEAFNEILPQTDLMAEKGKNLINSVARYVANELMNTFENEVKPQSETTNNSSTLSHLDHKTIPIPAVDYTLPPSINKTLIDDLQGPVDQTWQGTDYQVRFKRNFPSGDVELWWKKGQDDIYLHAFPNGAVDQNWGFDAVHIGLFRDEDGNVMQLWDFGNTKLEYIKDNNSPLIRTWENGNRNEASYWKYRNLIKIWCEANGFFVGEKSCIIY